MLKSTATLSVGGLEALAQSEQNAYAKISVTAAWPDRFGLDGRGQDGENQ